MTKLLENKTISKTDHNERLEYRGVTLDFFWDPSDQFYTELNSEQIQFGVNNYQYLEDAKKLIDFKLDLIRIFPESRSMLLYFNNSTFRDIKLIQQGRVLKIYHFPISDLNQIIEDAQLTAQLYFDLNFK